LKVECADAAVGAREYADRRRLDARVDPFAHELQGTVALGVGQVEPGDRRGWTRVQAAGGARGLAAVEVVIHRGARFEDAVGSTSDLLGSSVVEAQHMRTPTHVDPERRERHTAGIEPLASVAIKRQSLRRFADEGAQKAQLDGA